ncbi:MAG: amino acid permease, partial [Steroidobacteraceae bacterium]
MSLFRTQPVAAASETEPVVAGEVTLKRVLSARHLVLLGIGAVIGAGIFVMTGNAAANYAGPAIVLSFVMAGIACAFAGLCYAEFAAMLPVSGSAYSYSYATLGELVAWFIGWMLVLEYTFAAATVAVGWSGYFAGLLDTIGDALGIPLALPAALTNAPLNVVQGRLVPTGALINLPAVAIVTAVAALCYRGITQSATVNAVIVLIKVGVILLFMAFTLRYVDAANWTPFIPEPEGPGRFGFDGVVRGASVVFFAYIGFDAVSTAAQEAKNPQRDMPIGILGSLFICTLIY